MDMKNEILIFLAYGIGIFTIFFFGRLILLPVRIMGKLVLNSIMGAGAIALINIVGNAFAISPPLNILNAFTVGLLGIPGAILLIIILN